MVSNTSQWPELSRVGWWSHRVHTVAVAGGIGSSHCIHIKIGRQPREDVCSHLPYCCFHALPTPYTPQHHSLDA